MKKFFVLMLAIILFQVAFVGCEIEGGPADMNRMIVVNTKMSERYPAYTWYTARFIQKDLYRLSFYDSTNAFRVGDTIYFVSPRKMK